MISVKKKVMQVALYYAILSYREQTIIHNCFSIEFRTSS